jgi:hypothetical protein
MQNAERMQVLRMLDSGDVSIDEAIRMVSTPEQPAPSSQEAGRQQWLRVRVSNLETGAARVNLNIPMSLMRWGLGLCSRFAPELDSADLEQVLTELDQYPGGRLVEVEDMADNQLVEILIE